MENNLLKISNTEITGFFKDSYELLSKSSYKKTAVREDGSSTPSKRCMSQDSRTCKSSVNFSIIETFMLIDEENPLMSEVQYKMTALLQKGIALAAVISENYEKSTQLERLRVKSTKYVLTGYDEVLFNELKITQTYVSMFTLANFIQSKIEDNTSVVNYTYDEKVPLSNVLSSTKQLLYRINETVRRHVYDDDALQGALKSICLGLITRLKQKESSLSHTESFINKNFHSELLDTEISGFNVISDKYQAEIVNSFKKPEEVIGNKVVKYQLKKLAKMMMCYDFIAHKNPFNELGGFIFTFMAEGRPGTGKTALIQMLAGLLYDYCKVAGYPFYCEKFSIDKLDSYQGDSGQYAKQFISNITNPSAISFGVIDNIDQVMVSGAINKRTAEQQKVTAILMESLVGESAIIRGNCTIGMFTNAPEDIDNSLRQKVCARYLIDGPKTSEDFTDLLSLMLNKQSEIDTGPVNLHKKQVIDKKNNPSYSIHDQPKNKRLTLVFNQATQALGVINTFEKFGKYLKMIQDAKPSFTGQDIKNISEAAKKRSLDVDLPDSWFNDKSTFFEKTYKEKLSMISEFAKPLTSEMLLQELHRYADSEF
jgi:hypothetical protein